MLHDALKQNSWLLVPAFATALAGCGGDNVVREQSLEIQAFIEGTVIDGVTREPLAGATVTVPGLIVDEDTGEASSVETDSAGFYRVEVDGVGSHTLFVTATGYARAKYVVNATTEPGASGNITVTSVRNSQLYPVTGTLNGRVTSGGPRDAVPGARVLIQFLDGTDPIEDASLGVEATTSDSGNFSLDGLPAGSPVTRVTVFPANIDDDEEPDTATFTSNVTGGPNGSSLTPNGENFMEIQVDQFVDDRVIFSSIDDDATVAADSDLTLTYARPMAASQDSTLVRLTHGGEEVSVSFDWSSDGTTLTVTPREPLIAGEDYVLNVQARSLEGENVSYSQGFTIESGAAPRTAPSDIEIGNPAPIAWNQNTFVISWAAVPNAEGYRVFARNDKRQTAWVELFDGLVSGFSRPQVVVNLPGTFDTYPEDPVFSATGFETTVEFAVQAWNGNNDGPFSTETATVADTECPIFSVTQVPGTSIDNPTGVATTARFIIQASEPIADLSTADLPFTFTATSRLDEEPASVRRLGPTTFEVSFEVPPNSVNTPANATVDVSAASDTSLNAPDGMTCPESAVTVAF